VSLVGVFRKLISSECLTFCGRFEPAEEEGVGGDGEELVLRLLTILVHWLADSVKADKGVLEVFIVSVVSMRQDQKLNKFNEFDTRFST